MIPKLGRGSSFTGIGAYLLHDKEAKSTERVEWTVTRNLATHRPQAAIGVMAATAMDQARLKRQAGVKATGRKSKESVLHLTLSWHPDEADTLTKNEMLVAADGAIRALGAQDHQALVVAHSDSDHPHLHLVINRVSPADGRMLSSSKEKLKLSEWALAYEKERGEVLCKVRETNAASRSRGHYTRGLRNKPRHIFELEAANSNCAEAEAVREEQREKDRELRREDALQAQRHKADWTALDATHRAAKLELKQTEKREIERARSEAVGGLERQWRELFEHHAIELREFNSREKSLIGKASNAFRAIDWSSVLLLRNRSGTLKESFGILSSKGARLQVFLRAQQRRVATLTREETRRKNEATKRVRVEYVQQRIALRSQALLERTHHGFTHSLERAALRSKWRERGKQRELAWSEAVQRQDEKEQTLAARLEASSRGAAKQHMNSMRAAMNERAANDGLSPGEAFKKRAQQARDKNQERDAGWER